jgi:deoxyguanosine kinase
MYFAIEGVIGVGKTTLARLLQNSFDAELQFYSDRARYAFQTQIFFLLSRYHQQRREIPELIANGRNVISDYTFEKDALFAGVNIHGDELDVYHEVHEALAEKITRPDLIVYLHADTEVLMQRIASRDRSYERQMERGYIEELGKAYDEFFSRHGRSTPVLILETDQLDYVRHTEDLVWVENRIRQALANPPLQPSLLTKHGEG